MLVCAYLQQDNKHGRKQQTINQSINQSIMIYRKLNQCIRLSPEISPVHDAANSTNIDIALILGLYSKTYFCSLFHLYVDVTDEGLQIYIHARSRRSLSREKSSCSTYCDMGLGFNRLIRRTDILSRLVRKTRGIGYI